MTKYYTYIYQDPTRNNETIYVGKGQGLRCNTHLAREDKHQFVSRLRKIRNAGMKPVIIKNYEINEHTALEMEKFWINFYGRKDLNLGTLLNLTDGGEGTSGYVVSEETKQKLREARAQQANVGHVPKGHKLTEEHKEKISRAGVGRVVSQETKEKIRRANLGKKLSQELKDQISAKLKGRPLTDEHKAKMKGRIPANKGISMSAQMKQKISNTKKGL